MLLYYLHKSDAVLPVKNLTKKCYMSGCIYNVKVSLLTYSAISIVIQWLLLNIKSKQINNTFTVAFFALFGHV